MFNKHIAAALAASTLALSAVGVAEARNPLNPVPGKPGTLNIVDTALAVNSATGEFDYLIAAATCDFFGGAVVNLLSGRDRYTLFAPTDAAFEKLLGGPLEDPADICGLFEANPTALLGILTYHVTEGRRFSNSVFNRKSTKMVEMLGDRYIVTNPDLTINDNQGQTIGVEPAVGINVRASNGVIHTINTVLQP